MIGSEQLLCGYLCEFLISFLRSTGRQQYSSIAANQASTALVMLTGYMQNNVRSRITVSDLVKYSGSNRTTINRMFNEAFGLGAIEYFITLKTEEAKKYLREDNYNVTQISELLGYSNIHYFSRQFKKMTGMSPMEYSASIKAMNDNF